MLARLALFFITFLVVPQPVQLKKDTKESSTKNIHPGTIVDASRGTGIVAHAYAYGSQEEKSDGDCPVFDDSLDSQLSVAPAGDFTFYIPKEKSSYLSNYCQQGYASRTFSSNDNTRDKTRAQPDPIKLLPVKGTSASFLQSTIDFEAMATDLDQMTVNFSYYAKAAPRAFSDAAGKLRESDLVEAIRDRQIVLPGRPTSLRPKSIDIASSQVAFVAITTELDNTRSNFLYYEAADKEAFGDAYIKFPSTDQMIIDRIRKHSAPFLTPALSPSKPF
jgi:hypothetical protein